MGKGVNLTGEIIKISKSVKEEKMGNSVKEEKMGKAIIVEGFEDVKNPPQFFDTGFKMPTLPKLSSEFFDAIEDNLDRVWDNMTSKDKEKHKDARDLYLGLKAAEGNHKEFINTLIKNKNSRLLAFCYRMFTTQATMRMVIDSI